MNQAILNLIEEIEKEVEFEEYEADVSSGYFYAISKIKEKLSSFSSQWIDVKEELPEPDTDILVAYYGFNHIRIVAEVEANYEEDGKTMRYYRASLRQIENVTHWMPLPTPPNN